MNRITALSLLLARPLLMTERGFKACANVVSRGELYPDVRVQALEARRGERLQNTRSVTVRNGVATIPVTGPLVRHADIFDEISGATSYDALRKDLQVALDDPNVRSIVLRINSPGGEVTGCQELCDAIFAARAQKRIVAYVDGMACSAAYWIASACDEIVTAPTGELGSIGVMLAWIDDRGALEAHGYKEIRFVSSQSPKKNPDPEGKVGKAEYQKLVDDLAAVFVASVARNRGVSVDEVLEKFGQGGLFVGEHAVAAGLADRLGNEEAVLVEAAQATQPQRTASARTGGRETMTMEKTPSASMESGTCTGCETRLAGSDPVYCASCAGKGESAKGGDEPVDDEKKDESAKFVAQVLELTGAATAGEAIGAIRAGVDAREELGKVRQAQLRAELRAALEKGLDEKRLSLGLLRTTVPTLIGDEKVGGAMATAIAEATKKLGPKDNVRAALLDAICAADVTPADVRVISAYAKSSAVRIADEPLEPARDSAAEAAAMNELDREMARSLGVSEDAVKEYGDVRSAEDLRKKAKTKKGATGSARKEG
jgi:signal peptide peptidase SppA